MFWVKARGTGFGPAAHEGACTGATSSGSGVVGRERKQSDEGANGERGGGGVLVRGTRA